VTTPLPRSEFAVTERSTYLNHAAVGVLPRSTRDALKTFIDRHAEAGVLGTFRYEADMPKYRESVGRFIGARGSEIAILRNTGDGANVVAQGLDWKPGDRVILSDNEFPSNAIPWIALRERGVSIDFVDTARHRLTPDVLRAMMTDRTRVVTVSWVSFDDGYRHDLGALAQVAHERGALICVDAIQGLGAFPLDVRALDLDVVYAGGAKWLLSMQGVSFVYVREELLDQLGVGSPGWRSLADMWDFLNYDQPFTADASRFEGGTPNFAGALSLDRSIAVLQAAGPSAIAAHVLGLTDRLVEGLRACGANLRTLRDPGVASGIVTFSMPGADSVALGRSIQSEGIVTTWRPTGIRVAPHGYNTPGDIDHLLQLVPAHVRKLTA
jgi:cysteine desulfurase/selenocysteine lyase